MLTRDQNNPLQSDNVEDIGEINNSLIIESEVTKFNKTIGQLKGNSVYLLSDAKNILQDRPQENFVDDDNNMDKNVEKIEKREYEQAVSECKKLFTFIQRMVGRNITVFKKIYDHVRTEYGEIINASKISNGDDAIADVLNKYNPQQVLDTKHGKYQNILPTDDDIKMSMSRNFSTNFKENFQKQKWKHNMSLKFYHENIPRSLRIFG